MKISVAAAVNEPDTLAQCLARSPDIVSGTLPLKTYLGYSTAGQAYNAALAAASDSDIILFAHQDVYLPHGTLTRLRAQLEMITNVSPRWAVAGVIGGTDTRELCGQTWCSGHQRLLGARVAAPRQVATLDELLLIVNTRARLRFDSALPSFHLYGADIILQARANQNTVWVIDLPVVHHSRAVISLGGGYAESYRYIQRKWHADLPQFNLVCPLERSMWRYWLTEARLRWKHRHVASRPRPEGDPVTISRQIGYED